MKALTLGAALAAIAAVLTLGLVATAKGAGPSPASAATIEIHYSRFTPNSVSVRAGTPVTFTLRNDDPITHEWIVGGEAVHKRHRTGTEPFHAEIPTEVTIPALSTRVTTITFAAAGDYAFICHLPGHEEYGMRGVVHVFAP